MKILLTAAAISVGLCACASEPREISATPTSVSYEYSSGDLADPSRKAEKYCERQGGVAKLNNVGKADGNSVAMFECEASISR